ncbi:hypothetical protein HELRODRAFT_169709 [Helobdella robusta]|uniref:Uncharacterized protein n=1 Tax=Helobdella robusta TaxID=6412 RepID=T1F292_HELRO|nr:hypothetical protein HELRODRAFT_169709 [Helobdella robusta]ESO07991.1 hypothetical protein HELRODRAFT_169709 [Helobdella robusta]
MQCKSSKLASLFEADDTNIDQTSTKDLLTYTAPKNSNKPSDTSKDKVLSSTQLSSSASSSSSSSSSSSVLGTFICHCYKLLVHVQANNYVSFFDQQNNSWSILFDRLEDVNNFVRQVCLAKLLCAIDVSTRVIAQDIVQGEGHSIKEGDLVKFIVKKYRVTLNPGVKVGELVEKVEKKKNVKLKVKTGGEVIRLEGKKDADEEYDESLMSYCVGMNVGGAKLIASRDPNNAISLFELSILKVKYPSHGKATDSESTCSEFSNIEDVETDTAAATAATAAATATTDHSLHTVADGNNTETKLDRNIINSNPQQQKPHMDLQQNQVLPANDATEVTATITTTSNLPMTTTPLPAANKSTTTASTNIPTTTLATASAAAVSRPDVPCKPISPLVNQYHRMDAQQFTDPNMMVVLMTMLVDIKQLNNEIKTYSVKSVDKVELLSDQVKQLTEHYQRQATSSSSFLSSSSSSSPLNCSEVVAMQQSIAKIFNENERLKEEIEEKKEKLFTLSEKFNKVLDLNQKLMENNLDSNELNVKLRQLIDEKEALTIKLETSDEKLLEHQSEFEREIEARDTQICELKKKVDELESSKVKCQVEFECQLLAVRQSNQLEINRLANELAFREEKFEHERLQMKVEYDSLISSLRETIMKQKMVSYSNKRDHHDDDAGNDDDVIEEGGNSDYVKLKNDYDVTVKQLENTQRKYDQLKLKSKEMASTYDDVISQMEDDNSLKTKKIMSQVYKRLKCQIVPDLNYSGNHILSLALDVIKNTTLELIDEKKVDGRSVQTQLQQHQQQQQQQQNTLQQNLQKFSEQNSRQQQYQQQQLQEEQINNDNNDINITEGYASKSDRPQGNINSSADDFKDNNVNSDSDDINKCNFIIVDSKSNNSNKDDNNNNNNCSNNDNNDNNHNNTNINNDDDNNDDSNNSSNNNANDDTNIPAKESETININKNINTNDNINKKDNINTNIINNKVLTTFNYNDGPPPFGDDDEEKEDD